MSELEQRLVARVETLEVRAAYQEDTIAQLSDQVYQQQRAMDHLTHLLEVLEQKVKGLAAGESAPLPDNERPPHY